eukprot:TRINITY_DN3876_c0_g1_i1.p1 TRINITY_DN3876_c0_g1~~TRINITY_DN3876_c0_g1_i1.p1  ORF type:complete len:244 (-),score=71.29 TRINITY_DN3876_c0_g1_i1:200-931(-)
MSLVQKIDERTKQSFDLSSKFVQPLIPTIFSHQRAYRMVLCQFYYVVLAFEEELENHSLESNALSNVLFEELLRVESLEEDLKFFYGPFWKEEIFVLDVTKQFVERIIKTTRESRDVLIAYAYELYRLVLLHSDHMKTMMKKKLPHCVEKGSHFWTFDGIESKEEFLKKLMAKVNSLDLTTREIDAVCNEINFIRLQASTVARDVVQAWKSKRSLWNAIALVGGIATIVVSCGLILWFFRFGR